MSTERKGTEFIVGLFLLIGFGVIAAMVLMFGRGQGLKNPYEITVEFPNAGGLVKGCDVLLSGARIGTVIEPPRLTGKSFQVVAKMKISESVRIPTASSFLIRTNGMLGDSFVDVVPPADFDPEDVIKEGQTVLGTQSSGLDSLMAKGGKMMDTLNEEVLRKLNAELDEIQVATRAINKSLLSEQNLKNLQDTFANLKKTTDQFAEASKHLDAVVTKTGEAVDSAKVTLKTVDGAAGDVRLAIADVRKMSDSANLLVKKATNGEGVLGTLVSDKETADDLKALIANLRRSGVLFYKDRPLEGGEPATKPKATPPPRPRGR
jgi:phospholipid/cholesterol/gamma-HCH transport system substrate-binding protein